MLLSLSVVFQLIPSLYFIFTLSVPSAWLLGSNLIKRRPSCVFSQVHSNCSSRERESERETEEEVKNQGWRKIISFCFFLLANQRLIRKVSSLTHTHGHSRKQKRVRWGVVELTVCGYVFQNDPWGRFLPLFCLSSPFRHNFNLMAQIGASERCHIY